MTPKKELLLNLSLFLFSAIICFGLLELFLAFNDFVPAHPCVFSSDPATGWRILPHLDIQHQTSEYTMHIQTDSLGLRNDENVYSFKNVPRLVFLGDSFTYGLGVDANEAFPLRVREELREHGVEVEVINAGVGGYGTEQEYLFLRSQIDTFQPDAVIVGFFLGNDFEDNEIDWRQFHVNEKGCLTSKNPATNDFSLVDWFKSLRTVRVIYSFVNQIGIWSVDSETLRQNTNPALVRYTSDAHFSEKKFEQTKESIQLLAQFLREKDIPLFIVLIPEERVANQKKLVRILQERGFQEDEIFPSQPQEFLLSICEEEKISCLDMTPFLREKENPSDYYFPKDGHFTEEGQRFTAERITAFLIFTFFKKIE